MKVLGAEVSLATGSTGLTSTGAAWVFNTGSAGLVTVRNADDDGMFAHNDPKKGDK